MRSIRVVLLTAALAGVFTPASAEPAFAVRTGYRCSTCHVNRSGGGLRTPFGSIYTQTVLPVKTFRWREENNLLPANPDARFAVGGNFRAQYRAVRSETDGKTGSFEIPEANLFLQARLLPGKLSLYVDEKLGPAGASTRELFALYEFEPGDGYIKLGKFLPVYGWRLPDDEAFIRRVNGFTYSAPDIGAEIGFEPGLWSIHLSAVNGAGGGGDDNRSKQLSLLTVRRIGRGRIGLSAASNRPEGGRVYQAGLLAGWNVGRLALLAEADRRAVRDDTGERTEQRTAFLELDALITRGFNLKIAHDWLDPDREVSTDEQTRTSFGLEYIPYPFVQLRYFVRLRDGPPQVPGARSDSVEIEAHFFF